MAVTINAKGTSVSAFQIGKQGTTLHQGSSVDPSGVPQGDFYFDSLLGALKYKGSVPGSWKNLEFDNLSFLTNSLISTIGSESITFNDGITLTPGTGNVLIDTTDNALDKLQVNGDIGALSYLQFRGANPRIYGNSTLNGLLLYANTQSTDGAVIDLRGGTAATNPNRIRFFSGNSGVETAAFTNSGNMLIGTTTDDGSNKLQVAGSIYGANVINLGTNSSTSELLAGKTTGRLNICANTSAAGPKIVLFGDTHASAPGQIRTSIAGVLAQTVFPSGNVVIGSSTTDNGVDKLQVAGNVDITTRLRIGNTTNPAGATGSAFLATGNDGVDLASVEGNGRGSTTAAAKAIKVFKGTYGSGRAETSYITGGGAAFFSLGIVSEAGNTLLGTTTDDGANRLQVNGSAKITDAINMAGSSSVVLNGNSSADLLALCANTGSSNGSVIQLFGSTHPTLPSIINFYAAGALRARFAPTTGNFLIGTNTDDGTNKVQVAGGISATGDIVGSGIGAKNGTAAAPGFFFNNDADTGMYRFGTNVIGFSTNGAVAMTIGATGDVGSVGNMYSAVGSAAIPSFSFNGDTDTGMYRISADTLGFSTAGTVRSTITSSGLFFINRTTDDATGAQLQVSGSVSASGVVLSSDRRLKKNILPLSNALDVVSKIEGVNWEWQNADNQASHTSMGVIAQDLRKILVDQYGTDYGTVVGEETDSTYLSVNYNNLTGLLIEAIKELDGNLVETVKIQKAKIDSQEEKIRQLEEKLDSVIAMLCKIPPDSGRLIG